MTLLRSDDFLKPLIESGALPEYTQECILVCRARQPVQVYIVGLATDEWKRITVGMEVGVKLDIVSPATSEGSTPKTMGAADGAQ